MSSTSAEITADLGSTRESVMPVLRDPIPFNPPPPTLSNDCLPNFRTNNIPRYLFRVFTPKSCGETTDAYVRPPSTTKLPPESQHQDIFASFHPDLDGDGDVQHRLTDQADTAELLRRHLQFECQDVKITTNWGDVKILLLDTTKLPPSTFISEVELLEFFTPCEKYPKYGRSLTKLRDLRGNNKGYYFGEYLSQGDLKIAGACVQTDLRALRNRGLFDLLPELAEEWRWGHLINNGGVLSLREVLKLNLVHDDSPSKIATRDEVFRATELGKLFSSGKLDFTAPVAAMLLALRKRNKKEPVILDVFRELFSDAQIRSLHLEETKILTELPLPEVSQFRMIIQDLQQHFASQKEQPLQENTQEDESTDRIAELLAELDI